MPSSTGAAAALIWLRGQSLVPSSRGEALALYVHALLLTHGFRPASANADSTETAQQLPSGWGTGGYGGRYRHSRSSLSFDITATVVGARLVVHAAAVEDDAQMHTAEMRVADHVNEAVEFGQGRNAPQWDTTFPRGEDVATIVQVQIAHRLVPDAAKEGYEAAAAAAAGSSEASGSSSASGAGRGGRRVAMDRYTPADMDPLRDIDADPLRIGRARHPGYRQPTMPGGFGSDDLLAPGLPRGPAFGGGGGLGGGNLMGPGNFPGTGTREWPRPEGVPPGARFDPYTPFGPDNDAERAPGFEDEHGLGRGLGRGGGRGGARGGFGGAGRGDGGGGGGGGGLGGMYW